MNILLSEGGGGDTIINLFIYRGRYGIISPILLSFLGKNLTKRVVLVSVLELLVLLVF